MDESLTLFQKVSVLGGRRMIGLVNGKPQEGDKGEPGGSAYFLSRYHLFGLVCKGKRWTPPTQLRSAVMVWALHRFCRCLPLTIPAIR